MKPTREQLLSSVEAMLADIPRKTVDQNSMTVDEIAKEIPSEQTAARILAKKMVKAGKWEQVHKRVDKRVVMSYRKKLGSNKP